MMTIEIADANAGGLLDMEAVPEWACVTAKTAAAITGLSGSCLAMRRSRGQEPAFLKVGGAILYRLGDLRRFRDERHGEGSNRP